MISFPSYHDYYKKMLELQEKLRKSEDDRTRLVERFNLMKQESRLKHEVSINKLRMRYIEFLVEQRRREERNYKLLSALDRVDESLALMSAKTDRLCSLRKEYEALLTRAYANPRRTGSVAGDSGVVSQNEDRKTKKDPHHSSYVTPRSHNDTQRTFYTSPSSSGISRNLPHIMNSPTAVQASSLLRIPKSLDHRSNSFLQYRQDPVGNYGQNNALQLSPRESGNHTWADGCISNNFDLVSKKDAPQNMLIKELLSFQHPKCFGSATSGPKLNSVTDTSVNSKEERIGSVLENELDKYIHQIRSLHDNNDSRSLEGIEQNTSGDLLNETLSDESLYYFPVEEKIQKREIPTEMGETSKIADDLVSKIIDDTHVKEYMNHVVPHQNADEIPTVVNEGQKSLNESVESTREAVINASVNKSETQPVTLTPVCASVAEENIVDDVATIHQMESNWSAENIKTIPTPTSISDSPHSKSAQLQRDDLEVRDKPGSAGNIGNHVENIDSKDSRDQRLEVDDDRNFGTVNKLEVWNTEKLEIAESEISTNMNSNSTDILSHSETDVPSHSVEDKNFTNVNQNEESTGIAENDISTEIIPHSNIVSDDKNDINSGQIPTVDYDVSEQNYENIHQFEQPYTQDPQDYQQDPNQIYEYNNEHYHHDPNQPYQYDPNLHYEQNADVDYQYDQQNLEFIEDPNAQYQDQPYINDNNQQYVMNPDEEYHKFSGDSNQQYEAEAYAQNTNAAYDANAVYAYSNEHQNYVTDNDYEASQGFVPDQHHQEYREQSDHYETQLDVNGETTINHQIQDLSNESNDNDNLEEQYALNLHEQNVPPVNDHTTEKPMNVIENILNSDTDSIIEKNISNTESDFDFN